MLSFSEDDRRTRELHEQLLETHGATYKALNWGSIESQERRFEVLAGIGDLRGRSVLDVGCGLGDLYRWNANRGVEIQYTGIDLSPRLIEVARQRHPEAAFLVGGLDWLARLPDRSHDFVFASGIFYLRRNCPEQYVLAAVEEMFRVARCGVAFNCLSAWAEEREADEFAADPARTVARCRSLSPWLVMRHDYMPHDFSIYLYREKSR